LQVTLRFHDFFTFSGHTPTRIFSRPESSGAIHNFLSGNFYATFYIYDVNMLLQVYRMQKTRYSPSSTSLLRNAPLIIAVALAACLLVMPVMANPPSDVAVNIDRAANQIAVTITHPVADPATHYIRNVKVNINGRVVIDNDYKSQPTKDVFTYTYPVPVNAGDTVRVTTTCVLGGDTEKVITLPTPSATAPPTISLSAASPAPAPTTQKSPIGPVPVLGLGFLAVLALALNRK
jgi:hypothetical protein